MKYLLMLSLTAFLFLGFINSYGQKVNKVKSSAINKKSTGKESLKMQGAYSLLKQIVNDGTKDSTMKNEQFKIFTDRYMMYASSRTGDSLAIYGIGTYRVQNGKVMENIFYTSSDGARKDTFELSINKTGDNYSQIINFPADQGRTYILTEDYKNVSKTVTTPLDGAWKQTRSIYIQKDGNTMTDSNTIQFKLYQSGHFIWANTIKDSATGKPVSYFGYGSFEMDGTNKSKEVNSNSSFVTLLVGKPVELQLKISGKDTYQQTMLHPNGDRSIEVYQRLK